MKNKNRPLVALIFLTFLQLLCFEIHLVASEKNKRSKVIDFEDEVVEGMNRKPLDSLSHISDPNKKKARPHLYKKRVGFRTEIKETLKTMRYAQ